MVKLDYRKYFTKTTGPFFVFLFFFTAFSLVYFSLSTFVSLDDHFFHIRFAEIFRERGLDAFQDFKWLYFSKIAQEGSYFVYYNFLFYLFLIPFTFFSPLWLGIKFYGVAASSLIFTGFYTFLRGVGEKKAFLWVLVFFGVTNTTVLWRFLMARPFTLAPLLLLILLYFLHRKKYWGVFLVSLFYLWWHSVTFFFPLIVAIAYVIFEKFYQKKIDWKIVFSAGLGTIGALAITALFAPGFFDFINDVYIKLFTETLIGRKIPIAEGAELYPVNAMNFIRSNILLMILLLGAICREIGFYFTAKKKGEWPPGSDAKGPLRLTLFFFSILFLLGTAVSLRNIDFFAVFAGAYLVMAWNLILPEIQITQRAPRRSLHVASVVLVLYLVGNNFLILQELVAGSASHTQIEKAATWIRENVPDGEVVFHPTWNWFTLLFYYNPENYYIAGIEPRFLYDYNPRLYWLWWHISGDGFICGEEKCDVRYEERRLAFKTEKGRTRWALEEGDVVAETIRHDFQSEYVITSPGFRNLNFLLENNKHFEQSYRDDFYAVYNIKKE